MINTQGSLVLAIPTDNNAPLLFLEALAGYQAQHGHLIVSVTHPKEDETPMFYVKLGYVHSTPIGTHSIKYRAEMYCGKQHGFQEIQISEDVYTRFTCYINDNL
ncbi:hypothetical protein [Chitinophaga sp. YR573]|uniref:hypothetical protein n=1 Tax=Chitinophaga sp. YR573 TaxID=1881040 RepID=UPI00115F7BFF|nr:hypothetical protein [Chitinophaga sp. YR573]